MTAKVLKKVLPDLTILLLVVIVYLPVLHAGFIWDDDAHLTENRFVVGPGGLRAIWTSSAATYYPLVLTSFWIQHAIWGLHPMPYHVLNILMHAFCAMLLRRVLLRLTLAPASAWMGAAIWALHPVQTESAAWITELKNTQSGVFYLLALLFFLKWRNSRHRILYALFLLCAALALLSKTSTVMLPVIAVLCAWWLDNRWDWKTVKAVSPLVLLSAIAGGWTIWEQKFHSGATGLEWTQRFLERLIVAGDSVWFYLGKLVWPYPLSFIYPRWNVSLQELVSFIPAVGVAAALFALWWFRNGIVRPVFFAVAYFVVSLFPVLDLFDIYFFRYSFVGDHFQYLAAMGPLALLGAVLGAAFVSSRKLPAYIVSGTVIALLLVLTSQHAEAFHDNETLWRDTIAKNPDAWLAHNNLATIFMERGETASAAVELETTVRLQPNDAEGHANLANIFFESGRFEEAAREFQLALEGEPGYARIHDYLGVSLMESGRLDEGIAHMQRAIQIDPSNATSREHLGLGLWRQGKIEEAMGQFQEGVRIDPTGTAPRMRYGTALLVLERYGDATTQFTEIIKSAPEFEPAHKFFGIALAGLHQTDEAVHQLEEALRLEPADREAKEKLDELHALRK